MRDRHAEITAAGGRVVVIGLGDVEAAKALRAEFALPFPILVDAERKAYRAARLASGTLLGLVRPANFAARRRATGAGFSQKGIGKHPFQLGGSFVLGPGDVDLYARPSRFFGDNAPVDDLIDQVAASNEPEAGSTVPQ